MRDGDIGIVQHARHDVVRKVLTPAKVAAPQLSVGPVKRDANAPRKSRVVL
jgi:hypothetical protein